MPFYLGKGSRIVFTSSTRPGTVINLTADTWNLEFKDEAIRIPNIKILRDANIINNLDNKPEWRDYGVPSIALGNGTRDTKLKIHGFHYFDPTVSVNAGPRTPIINEEGKLEIFYTKGFQHPVLDAKAVLFKMDACVVTMASFDMSVTGGLEYDLEIENTSAELDYAPHPKS